LQKGGFIAMKRCIIGIAIVIVGIVIPFAIFSGEDMSGGYQSGHAIKSAAPADLDSKYYAVSFGNQACQLQMENAGNMAK
jgi:hypothetical protein